MKNVSGPMLTHGGRVSITVSDGDTVASVVPSSEDAQVSVSLHSRYTDAVRKLSLLREALRDAIRED